MNIAYIIIISSCFVIFLSIFGCFSAYKDGEKDDKARRDDDDIGSIHIQAISQQLIKERFVIHGPYTK